MRSQKVSTTMQSVDAHGITHDALRQQLSCLEWLRLKDAVAASEEECSSAEQMIGLGARSATPETLK